MSNIPEEIQLKENIKEVDDDDVTKISSIVRCFWNNMSVLSSQIKHSKHKNEVNSRQTAINALSDMRKLYLMIEDQSKFIYNSTVTKLKKFYIESSQFDEKNVSHSKRKSKHNNLSLKKHNTPVYTDDEITCVSFTLPDNIQQKSFAINNDIIEDKFETIKLNVQLDNYKLTFKRNYGPLEHDVNHLDENDEYIYEDHCLLKTEGEVKVQTNKLKANNKVKIGFYNIHCVIHKDDLIVPETLDVDSQQNDENNAEIVAPIQINAIKSENIDRQVPDLDLKKDPLSVIEDDDSTTHCTELSIANFEDFDAHTEILNESETEFPNSALMQGECEKNIEELKEILEDLLSEDSLDDDDNYQEVDTNSEDSDDEEFEYNMRVTEIEQKSSKNNFMGRVIDNNLLEMQQQIHESQKSECYVNIIRDRNLENMLNQYMDRHKDADEEEIQRLINLNSLKRPSFSYLSSYTKTKRKKVIPIISTTDTSDTTTNTSDTSTDDESKTKDDDLIHLLTNDNNPNDHNNDVAQLELLEEADSDKETSEKDSNSDDAALVKPNENEGSHTSENKRKRATKKRSKWRQDRLLNDKLTISSSSDSDDSIGSGILKKKVINKLDEKKQNKIVSEVITNIDDQIPSTSTSNLHQPTDTSANIILSLTSSDDDEEILSDKDKSDSNLSKSDLLTEYVVNIDSDSEQDNIGKGRRNIRPLLSDDVLAEETKKANKEEEIRKQRLVEKEKQLKVFYSQSESVSTKSLILDVDENLKPLVSVASSLVNRLKKHQKEGVKFIWDACFESVNRIKNGEEGSGCIMAHCMGLGKTFQVITLIHTLFTHPITNTKYVLIICPLSTVLNWKNEFRIGLASVRSQINIFVICDQTKKKKDRLFIVDQWWKDTGVLIMGYQTYVSIVQTTKNVNREKLEEALINPGPDLVICDEGHLLKNHKTNNFQKLSNIRTRRRIVLTGTPMQNNLKEYYYMIQFVKPNLLGSYREFTNRFVNPITNGQFHDSNLHDTYIMKKRSHVLHKLLRNTVQRYEVSELKTYLPAKNDFVLFVRLTNVQAKLYEKYVTLIMDNESSKKVSLFEHYHNLQLVWNHPLLLELKEKLDERKKNRKEFDVYNIEPDMPDESYAGLSKDWWKELCPTDLGESLKYGSKFLVARSIMKFCEKLKDKVLIFSSSLLELDALEIFLKKFGTFDEPWLRNRDYFRLDGTTSPDLRMILCNRFNDTKANIKALLISHRVGGLGLNLVAANRVILLDVCWNPSYDEQSVFRVYRFGQVKECFIYRLVTKGTLEETIYLRAINKLATAGRVIDERQLPRHFRMKDLEFLNEFHDDLSVPRPIPKVPQDTLLATLLTNHEKEIFIYHEHQSLLENLPEEELDEDEMKLAWEEFNKEKEATFSIVPQEPPEDFHPDSNDNSYELLQQVNITNAKLIETMKRRLQMNVDITKNVDPLLNETQTSSINLPHNSSSQLCEVIVIED